MASLHRQPGILPHHWTESQRYHRHINRDYLEAAKAAGFISAIKPITIQIYSETLQKFRLAGDGHYDGPQPSTEDERQRLRDYFDPLPIWYAPFGTGAIKSAGISFSCDHAATDDDVSLLGCAKRLAATDHRAEFSLYECRSRSRAWDSSDDDWVWVESPMAGFVGNAHHGRLRAQHGMDLECGRQDGRRLGTGSQVAAKSRTAFC